MCWVDIIYIALREQLGKAIRKNQPTRVFFVIMSKTHPGFQNAAKQISKKEGLSFDRAKAILASATRKASPAAKKANPNLKRVKG